MGSCHCLVGGLSTNSMVGKSVVSKSMVSKSMVGKAMMGYNAAGAVQNVGAVSHSGDGGSERL